jgi:hypothetical protein
MAKFDKFDPQKQIRGLAEAAKRMLLEERKREKENYDTVMAYFRRKAKTQRATQ